MGDNLKAATKCFASHQYCSFISLYCPALTYWMYADQILKNPILKNLASDSGYYRCSISFVIVTVITAVITLVSITTLYAVYGIQCVIAVDVIHSYNFKL